MGFVYRDDRECAFSRRIFCKSTGGFEHTADQIGPSSAKSFTLGSVELVVGCRWFLSGIFSTSSSVVAVVQDRMLARLGNVDEHPDKELERVEKLGFSVS